MGVFSFEGKQIEVFHLEVSRNHLLYFAMKNDVLIERLVKRNSLKPRNWVRSFIVSLSYVDIMRC